MRLSLNLHCLAFVTIFALFSPNIASAQDASYTLTIREGGFEPSTLSVKAGQKIALTVKNATSKTAEFESAELNREKVIEPGASVTVYIGPLAAGTYPFFDDFNQARTGKIIAK